MNKKIKYNKNYALGNSLIELMLALVIVSIGVLGASRLFLTSQQITTDNVYQGVAARQLIIMSERLITLQKMNSLHQLNIQLQQWNKENSQSLPHGLGNIAENKQKLSLSWLGLLSKQQSLHVCF